MSQIKNTGRTRIFLADLEQVKKEEWERRRKLRLQQVRQQARGIASIIRKQTKEANKHEEELVQSAQVEAAAKIVGDRKREMEGQLAECLTSVGTGHASAEILSEVDQLLQHKTELQESLARLRAELAAEKANKERSKPVKFVSKPQIGVTISKVKNAVVRIPSVSKSPPSDEITRAKAISIPQTPPSLISSTSIIDASRRFPSSSVNEKTILSPPFLARNKKTVARSKVLNVINGRKSCPPPTESDEAEMNSDSNDSDDSDRTWPPASVKKKKNRPSRVRMYDHSVKKCSEYVQKHGVVRMEDPSSLDMKSLIEEEEELLAKKAEENVEKRRVDLQRGMKALKEEIAKQDFDNAIKDCFNLSREKRLKKAYEYSSSREVPSGQLPNNEKKYVSAEEQKNDDVGPSVLFTDRPISSIVSQLMKKRQEILESESKVDSVASGESESPDEEHYTPPLWIQEELATQKRFFERAEEPKQISTPETVMNTLIEAERNGKDGLEIEQNSVTSASSNSDKIEETADSPTSSTSHSNDSPSNQDTPDNAKTKSSSTASSVDGINIEIQITADKTAQSEINQLGSKTPPPQPMKVSDSSTSYYSPPDPLNPQQMSVLSDILSKVSTKNDNPILRHYIARVLNMSRRSLSDLEVSSCSEVSIETEICSQSQHSTPLKMKKVMESNRMKNVHFDCVDNISTAGTISSLPSSPGDQVSNDSPDHTIQIARLLKNICKLQDIYFTHSSASETLSDSRSSYQSVVSKVNPLRVVPHVTDAIVRGEDTTGLFGHDVSNSNGTSFYQYSPPACGIQQNIDVNVPNQLNPQPFPHTEIQTSPPSRRSEGKDTRFLVQNAPRNRPTNERKIESLSDIESVVSSIQNSPDRKNSSSLSGFVTLSQQRQISTLSDISSTDFINSAEMSNNNLIDSSSSKSDVEDVFRSLGIGWALTTLRRTRKSQYPAVESSSKSDDSSQKRVSSSVRSGSGYRHSTPLKLPPKRDPESNNLPPLTPPDVNLHCPSLVK